jgi:DtxR family transcriptional regulator, Mn-dependent transcriptional regulator
MPTPTLEEYLETIYKLSQEGPVRPTQIADAIGVSGPTVTATLKRLEGHGLVTREGTVVVLTEEGVARSVDIVRRHRIAERFLVDTLGLDWEAAHEEACLLEHALSPRVLEALERHLGDPTVCPHGHPIPLADGSVAVISGMSLDVVEPGMTVTVLRVAEDEELLGYLGDIGMRPGVRVEVVAAEPFAGPLTVRMGGESRALAREVARFVVVEPA